MAGRYFGIINFILFMFFCVFPLYGQESATIKTSASVASPIGFKSYVSTFPIQAENESITIRRPAHGSLICSVEIDSKIVNHFTLGSCEMISETPNEAYYQLNNIDFVGDTLIITLIYSENR